MRKDSIRVFVRKVLGCECREEVFKHIECGSRVTINKIFLLNYKINVGNRLLIYIIEINDLDFMRVNLSELICIGIKERDLNKFNRFRLVIATHSIKDMQHIAQAIIASMENEDDRAHLHIINKNELPVF